MDKFSLKRDGRGKHFAFRVIINLLLLLALVLIIGINFFSSTQVFKLIASNRMVVHTYQVNQTIHNILLTLMEIESNTRGYIISGNKNFITKMDGKIAIMLQDAEKARQLTFDSPVQLRRFADLQPILQKRVNLIYELINAKNNVYNVSASELVKSKKTNFNGH